MSLTVLDPGAYSLIVDAGRPRHRWLGVPISGAADRAAFQQGNALVGNEPDSVALEIALVGPTLLAAQDTAAVVFGAPFDVAIYDRKIQPGTTFTVKAGETLRIGGTRFGMRGYLCVRGGFDAPSILDSRSALAPIKRGDQLVCSAGRVGGRSLAESLPSLCEGTVAIRCLAGPQFDWFRGEQFFGREFNVTPASNRMGIRLKGEPLDRKPGELTSEAVCPGTVQVVNDGQCIVLGVDGQTIGGYPKVAQVIAADVDRLGQLRPGQSVRFEQVTMAEAEAVWTERRSRLDELLLRLATCTGFYAKSSGRMLAGGKVALHDFRQRHSER